VLDFHGHLVFPFLLWRQVFSDWFVEDLSAVFDADGRTVSYSLKADHAGKGRRVDDGLVLKRIV
jgi:hypothetical protein